MALQVAAGVAYGQIGLLAAAALAARHYVLERGILRQYMLTTHPARHLAVQLARYGGVDFQALGGQRAHARGGCGLASACPPAHGLWCPGPHTPARCPQARRAPGG